MVVGRVDTFGGILSGAITLAARCIAESARGCLMGGCGCRVLQAGQGMGSFDFPFASEQTGDKWDIGELVDGDFDMKVGMLVSEPEWRKQGHDADDLSQRDRRVVSLRASKPLGWKQQ